MKINCEFAGGLELLFDGLKQLTLTMNNEDDNKITSLFKTLADDHLVHSRDLFLKEGLLQVSFMLIHSFL